MGEKADRVRAQRTGFGFGREIGEALDTPGTAVPVDRPEVSIGGIVAGFDDLTAGGFADDSAGADLEPVELAGVIAIQALRRGGSRRS